MALSTAVPTGDIKASYFLEHVTFTRKKKHIRVISGKLSRFQGQLAGQSCWAAGKTNETPGEIYFTAVKRQKFAQKMMSSALFPFALNISRKCFQSATNA